MILSALLLQGAASYAQHCCHTDSVINREIQFPLTDNDVNAPFYYFNNEWIEGATPEMVSLKSITSMTVKNDDYGNRAIFLTLSDDDLKALKKEVDLKYRDIWIHNDPVCEFPGGNGKFKEWIDQNLRIPDCLDENTVVILNFTVQTDGNITDISIYRPSKFEAANDEALRLANELPKFNVKYFTPRKKPIRNIWTVRFRVPGKLTIR